eukprot:482373-Rhodomonas_salina.1
MVPTKSLASLREYALSPKMDVMKPAKPPRARSEPPRTADRTPHAWALVDSGAYQPRTRSHCLTSPPGGSTPSVSSALCRAIGSRGPRQCSPPAQRVSAGDMAWALAGRTATCAESAVSSSAMSHALTAPSSITTELKISIAVGNGEPVRAG